MTAAYASPSQVGVTEGPLDTRAGYPGLVPGLFPSSRAAGVWTVVTGRVRSLVLRPRGATAAFEVDIEDGHGTVTLIWLGRRLIRGIDTGRWVRAEGRMMRTSRGTTMYNPRYTLLAGEPGAAATGRHRRDW